MRWFNDLRDILLGPEQLRSPEQAPPEHTVVRDEMGRTARHAAFAYFARGYRPSEVRAWLPIQIETLYSYFRSWRRRERVALDRLLRVPLDDPNLAVHLAHVSGLRPDQVREALRSRNPWEALNRALQQELTQLVDLAGRGRPVDADRAERLLSSYPLADTPVLRRRLRRAMSAGPDPQMRGDSSNY